MSWAEVGAYEWAVFNARGFPFEVHRGPMTELDAKVWVAEFEADGGKPGAFIVARRPVGFWERVDV